MDQTLILTAVFVAVLLLTFSLLLYVIKSREISKNIDTAHSRRQIKNDELNKLLGSDNQQIRYYLEVVQNEKPDSLKRRLVQAGFFSRHAIGIYNLIRLIVSGAVFFVVYFGFSIFFPSVSNVGSLVVAMMASGIAFILCSAILERMGKKRAREFRKLFPDFMDLLLVCVDAGLSIDAAIDRVAREFLITTPDFGVQLGIVNLEIRAGRPLHQALLNFADRIAVDEARTLAILFKQSAELGSSVSKTLRSFSKEMRQLRIIRAEEKANALPVKMLFPTALFMFPVNLVIVLVPILLVIMKMLGSMSPS